MIKNPTTISAKHQSGIGYGLKLGPSSNDQNTGGIAPETSVNF